MKFITVSGIDRSGKTSVINKLMEETFYRNYVVDRDPSNFYGLSVIQNNRGIDENYKKQYEKFRKKFSKKVDIAVFLYCDEEELKIRFKQTNEPNIVGELSLKEHQKLLIGKFKEFGYKKSIIINTTNLSISECVNEILFCLYNLSYQQKLNYGDISRMNCGCNAKIISYKNKSKIEILFDSGYKTVTKSTNFTSGIVKDKLCPTVLNKGILGTGKYKESDYCYSIWYSMMRRTYDTNGDFVCDRTISSEWHYYQIFAKWFDENYIEGYFLDKDLKLFGNKHYSKEYCMFVSQEINNYCNANRNNKKVNFHLPNGVILFGNGYSSSIGNKIRYSIKDAMNDYWNEKYDYIISLSIKYPELKTYIEDYFKNIFEESYDDNML